MKKLLLILCFTTAMLKANAQFEVIKYSINVDEVNFTAGTIEANTDLLIYPSAGLSNLALDLLSLQVDSIILNNSSKLAFVRTDASIQIELGKSISDTFTLRIFYQGKPFKDPSNFGGGFYIGNNYAYNIGVGFSANPHNLGRAWFPCVDNFTSRSSYSFNIKVNTGFQVFCNGILKKIDTVLTKLIYHYELAEKIPTYLASMNIAAMHSIRDTFQGINGPIPVEINVDKNNISNATKSFENLETIFHNYEKRFGPYRWPKIGFIAVPIVGGAMEHATNIAFNAAFANGQKTYESLFAHELSHHWFGDLVTCSSAEEMWLNEGFAVFCEYLFMEDLYGKAASTKYIRDKHFNVLKSAHLSDGGYYPVDNVPHAITYGTTVYEKGGLVANTLRHYLGDSTFMDFLKSYFDKSAFSSKSSKDLRDSITKYTGINVSDFFNGWVSKPGFPDFRIDEFTSIKQGDKYLVKINVAQKNLKANHLFLNNKSEVLLLDTLGNSVLANIKHSGMYSMDSVLIGFSPTSILLDVDDKMGDACSDYFETIIGTNKKNYPNAYCSVEPVSNPDSAILLIAHHWVAADTFKDNYYKLSNAHYWKIDGAVKDQFKSKITFTYRQEFDTELIDGKEESLKMMYRKNSSEEWRPLSDVILTTGFSTKDNSGSITVNNFKLGEYAFGRLAAFLNIPNELDVNNYRLEVYPNPNAGQGSVTWEFNFEGKIVFSNMLGQILLEKSIQESDKKIDFQLPNYSKGNYIISFVNPQGVLLSKKMLLN